MAAEGGVNSMQQRAAQFLNRATGIMPEDYRGELWIYAAGYVFLYTLLMLFYMSTFGFICIMIYIMLVTMLILRSFGIGPLASSTT